MKIQILLGVYNGARYLDRAFESVCAQTINDWSLLVRDDGSTDDTPRIIERWRQRLGSKIVVLPNSDRVNLGMHGNYSTLLLASHAPYITLLSHDDVYHPRKLSLTLEAMERQERKVGSERPILVYSDLRVVDEELNVISPSHFRRVGWHPPGDRPLGPLLVHSAISGGATLFNRALIELLGENPLCEDVWMVYVAAAFGDLVPLPDQTVDFLWHANNQPEQVALGALIRKVLIRPWIAREILHRRLDSLRPRVRRFLEQFRDRLSPDDVATLEAFIGLPEMGPLAKRQAIFRHGLFYASLIRSIGLLAMI